MAAVMNGRWSTGWCDCCAAPGGCALCCCACCCPCLVYGQNVEALSPNEAACGGNCFGAGALFYALAAIPQIITSMTGIVVPPFTCFIHMKAREAIRRRYNLPEDPCPDCLFTWCCSCCALIQEQNELTLRGARGGPQVVQMQPAAPNQMYAPQAYPVPGQPMPAQQVYGQPAVAVAQPVMHQGSGKRY